MFRKSDPQQGLFGVATQLSESARRRLKGSWAEGFRQEVLPGLLEVEPSFARLYGETGRPNFSVARVLGICILQEMSGLSDQSAVDSFCFDVRWQHALDVGGEEAYLSRRSLVEFRRRLVSQDPDMTLMQAAFEALGEKAIKGLGLSTKEQRLDSTLVVSNVRVAGLLELFRATTRQFLGGLNPQRWTPIPRKIRRWYERSGDGWFGLGAAGRRDKLDELLPLVKKLIELFAGDEEVAATEAYQLLVRVFEEHCEVKPGKKPPSGYGQPKKRRRGNRKKRRGTATRVRDEIVLKHKKGAT